MSDKILCHKCDKPMIAKIYGADWWICPECDVWLAVSCFEVNRWQNAYQNGGEQEV